MSETTKASGEIPATLLADASTSTPAAKPVETKAPATKPAAKPAAKATAKPVAKETHIADKIKALPRRRVWPD